MKRFLSVLIASMFLATAAYAAEEKKAEEKKAEGKAEGKEKAKDKAKAKATKEDGKKKHWQSAPITLKQRKARVRQILQKANKSTIGPADE